MVRDGCDQTGTTETIFVIAVSDIADVVFRLQPLQEDRLVDRAEGR